MSVTKNDATNWFNSGSTELAAREIDYFVFLGYNATDGVVIGFARIPYARQYSEFNTTSTNEKYCAISTITNAAATDPYEVIGRFGATLSADATYTWTVPTFTPLNLVQRPIFYTRPLVYLPVITTEAGTITTRGATVGQYLVNDRVFDVTQTHPITTNGTGTTAVRGSLPFTVATGVNQFCVEREDNVTGDLLQGRAVNTYIAWKTYNNLYPGGDGRSIVGSATRIRLV